MAMEIEAKYRLDDPEAMRQRLRGLDARSRGAVLETNRFFDWPEGHWVGSGRGLRVRVAESVTAPPQCRPTGEVKVTVTCKGPRLPGPLKVRTEDEFTADDAEAVAAVFESLGMLPTIVFQKRRDSWSLGGCTVELDEVPGLGHFLEIEGPDGEAIAEVAELIGMADAQVEPDTYVGLLRKRRGGALRADQPITF